MAYANHVELARELVHMASTCRTWIYTKGAKNLVHRVASESELAETPLTHFLFPYLPFPLEAIHCLYINEKRYPIRDQVNNHQVVEVKKLDLVSEWVIYLPSWESSTVVAEAEKNKRKVKAVSVDKWWRGRSRDIAEGGVAAS